MNKKIMLSLLLVLMVVPLVHAEWVQPVDCEKLLSGEMAPKEHFSEEEMFCFYGTGYAPETEVAVSLENEDMTLSTAVTTSSTGVLSSIGNAISSLVEGFYGLFVRQGDDYIMYPNTITVGNPGGCTDPEVPEFSSIAATLALLGAGYVAMKKRKEA